MTEKIESSAPELFPAPVTSGATAPANPLSAERDRSGVLFDPAVHRPEKKHGRWVRLVPAKRGRPPKPAGAAAVRATPDFADVEKLAAGAGPTSAAPGPAGVTVAAPDEYTQAAVATVSAVSTAAILFLGAHAAPKEDQVVAMVKAYADCYRHYGYAPDVPPWLGPVIATGVWVGPHLADQRSQENLQTWKQRIAGWIYGVRSWFTGKRSAAAAAGVAEVASRVT